VGLRSLSEVQREESGATLVISAMVLTVLMGMAGFAIDFGWLFWNGIKIQHGADAAALAGVIYEPGDQTTAYAEARGAAAENGYVDLSGGTSVTPIDFKEDPTAVDNANQLVVSVTHSVPTFFMRVFGYDDISISKRAVAEYALPLAMGSDLPYFGQDPTIPGRNPNFWANIHGYYTGRKMGDRFASQCNSGGSGSGCTKNPEARPTSSAGSNNGFADLTGGYIYGIDVPPGSGNLTVDIFDGPFFRGGGDLVLAGDQPRSGEGPTTIFMLYAPDPTPLDTSNNKLLCKVTYAPQDPFADFNGDGSVNASDDQDSDGDLDWDDVSHVNGLGPTGFLALWDNLCSVNTASEGEGIYPLRVVIEDPGGSDDSGLNRYSMRASTSVGNPRFYGLGDMAVYVNFASNKATFNLAEVPEVHKGKELVIELWDPDSGNSGVRIETPTGALPDCSWNSTEGSDSGGALIPCNITGYADGTFNDEHMQIRIAIPNDYSCSANCWWTIEVTYDGGANDTTTWSARIEGNPVKLVE
jgi:hypothetical protein